MRWIVLIAVGVGLFPAFAQVRPAGQQPKVEELPFGTRVTIGTDQQGRQVIELPFGAVLRAAVWNTHAIPVCWENATRATSAHQQRVQQSVTDTWQRESRIRFVGWQACAAKGRGIRIRISDDEPRVEALGQYIDARPSGMVLNFTFARWSPACQTRVDFCAWAIAVHEFGHALGFAHEQNRPDAPFECRGEAQGTTGDWNVTLYDPSSVMNYCNKEWNNNGQLSDRDILAVRTIYGQPQ